MAGEPNMHIPVAKPAASILLVRNGSNGIEVLMTKRAKSMAFAPSALVFPGGKVEEADTNYALWADYVNVTEKTKTGDFSYKMAAIRELYEETSVLLTEGLCPANTSGLGFRECVLTSENRLNVSSLVFFAHWITPENMKLRFDTHFYLAAYNGDTFQHDGNEAVSLCWVSPKKVLKEAEADDVFLMFPTRLNLIKLSRANSVEEAIEFATKDPVVRTMPVWKDGRVSISKEAAEFHGYDDVTGKP
ncbi:NUDIX hydrolase [Kordiimonas pumila]|uniref:NUDIX domain-containing protein n=1 Tax=Kordiimonas pumila TaxID=2161677 RepID=A0ABV7D2F1_9PROT|nr:NUDIX hydrolase [Kordiimonas pumila]